MSGEEIRAFTIKDGPNAGQTLDVIEPANSNPGTEILIETLAKLRERGVKSIAVAAILADGTPYTNIGYENDFIELLGAIEWLKKRLWESDKR